MALLLARLVALVLLATALTGCGGASESTYVVPPSAATALGTGIEPAGAAAALERLQRAIRDDDRAGAVALAGTGDPAAGDLLGDLVDTAAASHLTHVTFRYVDEAGGLDAAGVWPAAVDTTWQFDGFDSEPVASEVLFSFAAGPGGVTVAGVGGSTLRTPVWMSGPVQVARTADTLVLVAGTDPALLTTYVGYADRAVPIVLRVVTSWRPRLVVEVPRNLTGLDRALAAPHGSNQAIAALATNVGASSAAGTPVHILVNPDVFGPLPRLGGQVVMSHEVTHLATDAFVSQSPTWLKEGLADFVALRDVTLPLSRSAGQIQAQVRADGLPSELPTAADFDPSAPHLGAIYEAAWLVCVTLADRSGQAALLRLYDETSRGADLDATLQRLFGWSSADLLVAWRARLSDLAA